MIDEFEGVHLLRQKFASRDSQFARDILQCCDLVDEMLADAEDDAERAQIFLDFHANVCKVRDALNARVERNRQQKRSG